MEAVLCSLLYKLLIHVCQLIRLDNTRKFWEKISRLILSACSLILHKPRQIQYRELTVLGMPTDFAYFLTFTSHYLLYNAVAPEIISQSSVVILV